MDWRQVAALVLVIVSSALAQYAYDDTGYGSTEGQAYGYEYSDYQPDHYQDYDPYDYTYNDPYSHRRELAHHSRSHRRYPHMARYQKSYGYQKPEKVHVPVVIKKKKQKKKKILTTHHGFFIRGGTAMFGKFKDLHSCEKACEITPTCFAGDYNPWLGKCFLHSNITACGSMSSHKAITHFKKVPCDVLETSRGVVVLGASTLFGIEIKGIDTLQDCIKKCVTSGRGIASNDNQVVIEGQVCCNIDYDFATHKCFMHPCVNLAITNQFCIGLNIDAPVNSIPNPSVVTITFCPRADDGK